MKYLGGYITAAILGAITWVLMQFGERFSTLVDMVYPYVIRTLQGFLAQWSSSVDFLIWQLLAVVLVVVILASLVLVLAFKKSVISWGGWVLSALAFLYLLHTMFYGLNYYAGDLADDLRKKWPSTPWRSWPMPRNTTGSGPTFWPCWWTGMNRAM